MDKTDKNSKETKEDREELIQFWVRKPPRRLSNSNGHTQMNVFLFIYVCSCYLHVSFVMLLCSIIRLVIIRRLMCLLLCLLLLSCLLICCLLFVFFVLFLLLFCVVFLLCLFLVLFDVSSYASSSYASFYYYCSCSFSTSYLSFVRVFQLVRCDCSFPSPPKNRKRLKLRKIVLLYRKLCTIKSVSLFCP